MKIRAEIIADARKIRDEITQIFIDSQHWNTHVRKEDESYIDPDPNGDLVNLAMSLDNLLEGEKRRAAPGPDRPLASFEGILSEA